MPNVSVSVDNKTFNDALQEVVRAMKKDAGKETMRQAKLLALAIANAAPPRIKGLKGLAAGIPNAKKEMRRKVIVRLVKPAYSMRVIDAVRMGPTEEGLDVLYGIATTRKRDVFTATSIKTQDNAMQRILRAAQKDTIGAMKNLRQLLKNAPNGITPKLYQDYNPNSSKHYKRLLDRMGKEGLGSISWADRVFLREPIKRERLKILSEYVPTVGKMKAGWIQAAMALPVNAGRKPPNWLLSKPTIGSASVAGSGTKIIASITNSKGNAINFNSRVDYVGRSMRYRARRMRNGIQGFMKRTLQVYYKRKGMPIPSNLQDTKRTQDDETEVDIY